MLLPAGVPPHKRPTGVSVVGGETASARRSQSLTLMFRLGGIYVALVATTLLIVGGLTLQSARNEAASQINAQMLALSRSFQYRVGDLASSQVASGQDVTTTIVSETVNFLENIPTSSGQVVYVSLKNGSSTFSPKANTSATASLERLVGNSGRRWLTVHPRRGDSMRVLRVPFQASDGSVRGTLTIGMPQSTLDIGLLKSLALGSGIALALAILLGLAWIRRVVASIQSLSSRIEPIRLERDPTASHARNLPPTHNHDLPPMLAEKLILLCTPPSQSQPLIGDLREEFSRFMLPQYGGRFARLWYWKQAFSSMPPLLQWRLTRFLYLGWLLDSVSRWLKGG